eukprot:766906-Hanusia_phi.AAC.2
MAEPEEQQQKEVSPAQKGFRRVRPDSTSEVNIFSGINLLYLVRVKRNVVASAIFRANNNLPWTCLSRVVGDIRVLSYG